MMVDVRFLYYFVFGLHQINVHCIFSLQDYKVEGRNFYLGFFFYLAKCVLEIWHEFQYTYNILYTNTVEL